MVSAGSVEEALEKAAASDLNAFVELRQRAAAEVAQAPGGPLQGVPVAVKDMLVDEGRAPTCGSKVHAPGLTGTAESIARLRAAGAIVIGYTNLHEWGVGTTSIITATGPIQNPMRPGRCTGGSSGGSAAALAAGIVPMAVGTDAGGSIRIPSAFCGVTGIKPTFGRVPTAGFAGGEDPVDHVGPMARRVEDLVLMLAVMAGDLSELPMPGRLRVGIAGGHFTSDADSEIVAQVRAAIDLLAPSVASVGEVVVDGAAEAGPVCGAVVLSFTAASLADELRDRPDDLQVETRSVLEIGSMMGGGWPAGAEEARDRLVAGWDRVFETVDVVITPTVSTLPPSIDNPLVDSPSGPMHVDVMNTSFNGPMNLAGVPCLSLPCGELDGGTVNLSITAPRGKDEWALATGLALERALSST